MTQPEITNQIYFSGDEYFQACLDSISKAQKSITLKSYIFEVDNIGMQFLAALDRSTQRGATVLITIDGWGSYNSIHKISEECLRRKFQFRVHHPILSHFRWLNRRDHRKFILIDDRIILLGSFNISKVHSFAQMGRLAWRDTGIKIEFTNKSLNAKIIEHPILQSNIKPFERFLMNRKLNRRIKTAQKFIHITNPYFIPRPRLIKNLKKSAKNGVQVKLLLPSVSDVWLVRLASRSIYRRLLNAGINIYEYQPCVLHAKTIQIDNWATIGSLNLNHRSLLHDLEIEAILTEPKDLKILSEQWEIDLKNSKKITKQDLEDSSIIQKILGQFVYWFRYWL